MPYHEVIKRVEANMVFMTLKKGKYSLLELKTRQKQNRSRGVILAKITLRPTATTISFPQFPLAHLIDSPTKQELNHPG